jgi:hypothetical protein
MRRHSQPDRTTIQPNKPGHVNYAAQHTHVYQQRTVPTSVFFLTPLRLDDRRQDGPEQVGQHTHRHRVTTLLKHLAVGDDLPQ